MKTITFVTGNPTKISHANEILQKFGFEAIGKKLDIVEPKEGNPEKVVAEKARQAFQILGSPLIVEDSGIFIKALNDFPGTFVHFAVETIGIANILKMMDGVGDRHAEFRQSLAYIEPGTKEPKIFSYTDGNYKIANKIWEPAYESDEFDRILIPPGETQSLCMFTKEWRAKRDAEVNSKTIHYKQLANWLTSEANLSKWK